MSKQQYNLQQGLEELRAFIKECAKPPNNAGSFQLTRMFYHEGLGRLQMNREQSIKYERVLEMLSPDEGSPRTISRASVELLIQECVLTSLDVSNNQGDQSLDQRIDASLKILRKKLESPLVDWEVWLPVARIKVGEAGFTFGNAFFCNKDHELARQAKGKVGSILETGKNVDVEAFMAEIWPEEFSQFTLCRIVVQAVDKTAARELAAVEWETTASVLNFLVSLVFPVDWLPLVCLPSELPSYETKMLVLGEQPTPTWRFSAKSESFEAALNLNAFLSNDQIKKAMGKANDMLRNESENEYCERLITAMKWAGKGAKANRREDAFLFYSIALEALLLGGKHYEQLSYRLRLRAAHLLGDNQTERIYKRNQVNDLYKLRSRIVHTGKLQIPRADLDALRRLTKKAILRLLKDPQFDAINTEEALEAWFEDALMCGPDLTP